MSKLVGSLLEVFGVFGSVLIYTNSISFVLRWSLIIMLVLTTLKHAPNRSSSTVLTDVTRGEFLNGSKP